MHTEEEQNIAQEDSASASETNEFTSEEESTADSYFIDTKRIVEALIFASDEPIAFAQLRDILAPNESDIPTAAAKTVAAPELGIEDSSDAPDAGSEDSAVEGETGEASANTDTAINEEKTRTRKPVQKKKSSRFTITLLKKMVDELNGEYERQDHVFRIIEVAGGFSFQTTGEYGIHVGKLFAERTKRRLTQAALETLAIIAFKQPISKPSIESIRGVNVDYVIKSLLERNLIAMVGRDDSVGRPLMYGTTKNFLKHFGLRSLNDLPKPREIQELLEEQESTMELFSIEEFDVDASLANTIEAGIDAVSIFDSQPAPPNEVAGEAEEDRDAATSDDSFVSGADNRASEEPQDVNPEDITYDDEALSGEDILPSEFDTAGPEDMEQAPYSEPVDPSAGDVPLTTDANEADDEQQNELISDEDQGNE